MFHRAFTNSTGKSVQRRKHVHRTYTVVVFFLASILAGCGSNVKDIPASATPVPTTKTYNSPLGNVWNAAKRYLSKEESFKIYDKSSGMIVTEFRTVDSEELSIIQTTFLGKTYKSSYTINFESLGSTQTDVTVNVQLQAVQIGFFSREEDLAHVEGYLRKKLFDGISAELRR